MPTVPAQGTDLSVTGNVDPIKVEEGETVKISLTVTNDGDTDITDHSVQIFIYRGTPDYPQKTLSLLLPAHDATPVSYNWQAKGNGEHTVLIIIIDGDSVHVVEKEMGQTITVKKETAPTTNPLFRPIMGIPLLYLLIIIIIIVVIIVVVAKKKMKKKDNAIEITTEGVEIKARVSWGKMPEDYYTERRDRLAKLRPVGLTRDGRTILGNVRDPGQTVHADEIETDPAALPGERTCSKCGYDMKQDWKTCMRCEAANTIREVKELRKEVQELELDLRNTEVLIRQAEASLEAESFTEADVFALDARTKIIEAKRAFEIKKSFEEESEKKEEPEVRKGPDACSSCGMGLQSDWDRCPVCGLTIEEMLKPKEETPETIEEEPQVEVAYVEPEPERFTCDICGNEKDTADGPCMHCNTGNAVSNAEQNVKDLRMAIEGMSLSKEDQMDVNEAIDLFQDAKGAFFDKDYQTAVGLAGETIDLVEEIMKRLKVAAPASTPTPTSTPVTGGNKCPSCGMSVKPNWEVCPMCDAQIRTIEPSAQAEADAAPTCPSCGKPVKPHWTMCPFCENVIK